MTKPPTGPIGFGQAADTSDSNEEDDESSPITRGTVLASALAIIDRDGVVAERLVQYIGRTVHAPPR